MSAFGNGVRFYPGAVLLSAKYLKVLERITDTSHYMLTLHGRCDILSSGYDSVICEVYDEKTQQNSVNVTGGLLSSAGVSLCLV